MRGFGGELFVTSEYSFGQKSLIQIHQPVRDNCCTNNFISPTSMRTENNSVVDCLGSSFGRFPCLNVEKPSVMDRECVVAAP